MSSRRRPWLSSFGAVILLIALFAWRTLPATSAPVVEFRTMGVERSDLVIHVSATGTVEPEEVVDVGAQVAGMIREFGLDPNDPDKAIDYGTAIEQGTVLARIDESLYRSSVNRSKAQVAQAKAAVLQAESQIVQAEANVRRSEADLDQLHARLYLAERDFRRAETIRKRGGNAISESDYDNADASFRAAKANLQVGEASLGQIRATVEDAKANVARLNAAVVDAEVGLGTAEINLGYCTVKSPVKGVIIDRRVNVGQTVVASLNTPSLFLIAKDLKRVQVWASVNEADIGMVRKGLPVQFRVDAQPGKVFRGEIAQVRLNAMMTQNVVTYTVVVSADNSELLLLPYLTANVEVEVARRTNALLVPNAALRWTPEKQHIAPEFQGATPTSGEPSPSAGSTGTVWISEGRYVRPVQVQLGLSDGSRTEVLSDPLPDVTQVVVGIVEAAAPAAASNPFIPKIPGKKK